MNIASKLKDLKEIILDESKMKRVLCVCTYATLGLISLVMTVMNLITSKGTLTWVTGIFTVLCFLNLLLLITGETGEHVAAGIFSVEVLAMFSYFLISGEPDGFSALWISILPFVSMLFYNRRQATVLCGIMLAIIVFLLCIPFAQEYIVQYKYNDTFRMRFPFYFCACYLIAFFLETLRSISYSELSRINKLHEELSLRDQLTELYNRTGMYDAIKKHSETTTYRKIGIVILDIDFFKVVNDTYGHSAGDKVLHDMASLMRENLNAIIARWGGEEFAFVYYDDDVRFDDLESFRVLLSKRIFAYDGVNINITASMGVFETNSLDTSKIDSWIKNADLALYKAKETGRNRVVYF